MIQYVNIWRGPGSSWVWTAVNTHHDMLSLYFIVGLWLCGKYRHKTFSYIILYGFEEKWLKGDCWCCRDMKVGQSIKGIKFEKAILHSTKSSFMIFLY